MTVLFRIGRTRVAIAAAGCEDCGCTPNETVAWSQEGRWVQVAVGGRAAMLDLPLCQACADRRGRGEFAGLRPDDSDKPLEGGLS